MSETKQGAEAAPIQQKSESAPDMQLPATQAPPAIIPQAPPAIIPQAPPAIIPQAPPAIISQAPPAIISQAPPAIISQAPPAIISQAPPAIISQAPPAIISQAPPALVKNESPPAIIEHEPASRKSVWTRRLALIALIGAGGVGFLYWQAHRAPAIPAWIVYGNGRLEADPIDIDTKFAGRILELRVDEGDLVKAGQVLALMDTRDLAQSLKKSEAQVEQAQKAIGEAQANLDQLRSQTLLAKQEMDRADGLIKNGWITRELYDQRRQQLNAANSAQLAAEARLTESNHALQAAQHDAGLVQVNINDNTLVAPRDGRIEYRIANVGEVLAAGGKVFTMLDTSYVYMDVYLPTLNADKIKIGDDARIVLDAYPDRPIPAKASFIADQAQFTPKMVETQTDRDKLMFRIRVRIDPERSQAHAPEVRSGLPGVAYVKTDASAAWPATLAGKP